MYVYVLVHPGNSMVSVWVCEGEVRSLRGDDMHVSRLLTTLRIVRLVGCRPPSHDGHSGNSPLSLACCCLGLCEVFFFSVCFHCVVLWWYLLVMYVCFDKSALCYADNARTCMQDPYNAAKSVSTGTPCCILLYMVLLL